MRYMITGLLSLIILTPARLAANTEQERLANSAEAMEEIRNRHRRELWARSAGLPDRKQLYRSLGCACDVSPGRRKHRPPTWRPGHRFSAAGHEPTGRRVVVAQ